MKQRAICTRDTCFDVGDIALLAKLFDKHLRGTQIFAGHSGKEMMLDLIVETTVPEIGEDAATNIARGQDLALEEAEFALFFHNWHAFMIGGKGRSQDKARNCLIDGEEQQRLPDPQAAYQYQSEREPMDQDQDALQPEVAVASFPVLGKEKDAGAA